MNVLKKRISESLFNQRGNAIITTMAMGAIGMMIGVSSLELVQMMNRTNRVTRYKAEVENFATRVKNSITFENNCQNILGNVTYTGAVTNVGQFNISGPDANGNIQTVNYLDSASDISAGLKLTNVNIGAPILNASASPYPLQVGAQKIDYKRYITTIELMAGKVGGMQMAPRKITATIYTRASNNRVEFCAASADADECTNMGGVYTPGQSGQTSFCDVRPAIGGCAEAGHYMYVNDTCAAGNVHMPLGNGQYDCDCPTGFVSQEVMNFQMSKNNGMYQFVCLNCAGAVTPGAGIAESRGIRYDAEALERDLACMQGITDPTDEDYLADCPCSTSFVGGTGGPTSTACGCQQGTITGAQCDDTCTFYPDSCECGGGDYCTCYPSMCAIW